MFPPKRTNLGNVSPEERQKFMEIFERLYIHEKIPQLGLSHEIDHRIIKNMLLAAATLRFPGLEFADLQANHVLIKNDVFNHLHAQEYVRKDQEQHRRIDQDLDKCFIILLRELKNGGPRAQLRSKL